MKDYITVEVVYKGCYRDIDIGIGDLLDALSDIKDEKIITFIMTRLLEIHPQVISKLNISNPDKIFPKLGRGRVIEKYKKENKSIEPFMEGSE